MTAPTTSADAQQLVNKLWSYCHVLRHDGVSTIDYVDQLTLLLFLKMADERARNKLRKEIIVPPELGWQALMDADAKQLKEVYDEILDALGSRTGALGRIFHNAQNKIRNAATLKRLIVDLIDKQDWSSTKVDIKGDAYEALLERGAEDTKSGAGQYFTPRALIDVMVRCMRPTTKDTIIDPACGTGGFLLAAHEYIQDHHGNELSAEDAQHLRTGGGHRTAGADEPVVARHRPGRRRRARRRRRRAGRKAQAVCIIGAGQSAVRPQDRVQQRRRVRPGHQGGPRLRAG